MRRAPLALSLALLLVAGTAAARPSWMQEGKAGRFLFNLKVGGSLAVKADLNAGVAVAEIGVAVTPDRNGYLVLPLQIEVSNAAATLMIPIGFQYDIALVPGLYVYPRVALGYAAVIPFDPNADPIHSGFVLPEVGVKLVVSRRWNLGVEPFSLPIFFGRVGGRNVTRVSYRALAYAGVDF